MYLRRLTITGCRSLSRIDLPFEHERGEPRLFTVIHGDSATCKTTLLRMIALAAAGPARAAALVGDAAAYRDPRSDSLPRIEARFDQPGAEVRVTVELPASGESLRHQGEPAGFVAAYGAGRALQPPQESDITDDLGYARVAGVFRRWAPFGLAFAHGTFGVKVDHAKFVRALRSALIDRMRMADLVDVRIDPPAEPKTEKIARTRIRREGNARYYIQGGDVWAVESKQPARLVVKVGVEMDYERYLYFLDGDGDVARRSRGGAPADLERFTLRVGAKTVTVPSSALSHGQQALVALVADVIGYACVEAGRPLELDAIAGLVIVDDLDLHLDARWQGELVPALQRAFPRVQFVASTRSPSVLTGCKADQVWTLTRDETSGDVVAAPWRAAMH
ncbi:MAG TPA: hypothetical protein VL463_19720 [Kofleriaceae bacterium]|nr:hypothetical protein [Kofleriaceae bacterium]